MSEGGPRPIPDPSVVDAVKALYEALAGSADDWIPELISRDASVVVIGTDPEEWWHGYDVVRDLWSRTRAKYGANRLVPARLLAQSLGDLAWATDEPTFAYATGETGALRLTMVFGRSGSGWLLRRDLPRWLTAASAPVGMTGAEAHGTGGQPGGKGLRGDRPAHEEALGLVAAELLEPGERVLGLHALGHDREPQIAAQVDGGAHDHGVVGAGLHVHDDRESRVVEGGARRVRPGRRIGRPAGDPAAQTAKPARTGNTTPSPTGPSGPRCQDVPAPGESFRVPRPSSGAACRRPLPPHVRSAPPVRPSAWGAPGPAAR